jgi:hypothetical protein
MVSQMAFRWIIAGLYIFGCLTACKSELVLSGSPSAETSPKITPITALFASPGDILTIKGKNLSPKVSLLVNDAPVELTILDRETARFILPEEKEAELYRLDFLFNNIFLSRYRMSKSSALKGASGAIIDVRYICDTFVSKDQTGNVIRGRAKCGSTSMSNCLFEGQIDCLTTEDLKAASTQAASQKIAMGETVAGISGSAAKRPKACTGDGEEDCVVDGTGFGAADLTHVWPSSIRESTRIAGVQGSLPNCSSDGEIGCVISNTNYAAASLSGASSKIIKGQSLAGITGSALPAPRNCSTDNDISCVATSDFPAVAKASITPGMIKAGVVIAGINGAYPSLAFPLASNTAISDLTTFQSQLTHDAGFEFFDSTGLRYSGHGDSNLLPTNIRSGTSIESLSLVGTMPRILPSPPLRLKARFFTGPNRTILSWDSSSGAAGYMLVVREGAAVSFSPASNQIYTSGSQGNDTIIYIGSDLTFVHNAVASGSSFHYALFSYDSNRFYSPVPTRIVNVSLFCQGLEGGSWVAVPGDPSFGTNDFCVQKFEAKDVGGIPTSQAAQSPWASITQTASIAACRALGPHFDLISNEEWLTIAANIAQVPSNWSSGIIGTGTVNRGHSDNNPASACGASSDDALAWVHTDCSPKDSNGDVWRQKRTHTLSTGALIWDISGNVSEWTSYTVPSGAKP